MTKLSVVFVWHMHQPYYRDMVTGRSMFPWVRLHAAKGYLDMARAVEDTGARVVMNLTPCLVRQLEEEIAGARDDFFLVSQKPAAELSPSERAFILQHFFMADWETMVKPFDGYMRLLGKRGTRSDANFEQLQKNFSTEEIRDLAVWFNLAWVGWHAEDRHGLVAELVRKGRAFSEDDKRQLLELHLELEREVLPYYQRLWEDGLVEVSTTPNFHPIMPLVYDTVLADRCQPGVRLPQRFRHPEDVAAQVTDGLAIMERAFGRQPVGMWPSEGSVAPEIVPLLADAGVRWIGTDEDNLMKRVRGLKREEALFHPWKTGEPGRGLNVLFRDHGLSDLIGFNYARMPAAFAAEDLVRRFREIRGTLTRLNQKEAMVAVILDGENPWQAFPDGGREFLHELYCRVQITEGLELTTAADYLERHPAVNELDQIGTGSWIRGNFSIWIGHPEDNKGWDYLGRVRDDLTRLGPAASEDARRHAFDAVYAAEGSDWFWWYGDDFQSGMDAEFDYLFRLHLRNVYTFLGEEPPWFLNEPVIQDKPSAAVEEPTDFISPVIDGRVTDYYEWRTAGRLDVARSQGAMFQSSAALKNIFYGFDAENFYLRLDPCHPCSEAAQVRVSVLATPKKVLVFGLSRPRGVELFEEWDDGLRPAADGVTLAAGKIIELRAPFARLGLRPGVDLHFRVEILEDGNEVERYPRDGYIRFPVPDEDYDSNCWSV